jgi:hypothetical protein
MRYCLQDQALRAWAASANSNIIICAAAVGTVVGGPIGAMVAAAIATPGALLLQQEIGRSAGDPRVAAETPEVTMDRVFGNMVVNIIGTGAGAALSKFFEVVEKKVVQAVAGKIVAEVASKTGVTATAQISDKAIGYVSDM